MASSSGPTSNSIGTMPAIRELRRFPRSALASRKRKMIRRERRDALANGITVHWLTGTDLTEDVWDAFFAFYMDTGSRKWGRPYLTRAFFSLIGAAMAERIVLVMAKRAGRWIAGAINFIGSDTLYGRHWGAIEAPSVPAFRALLLPGHRLRDRARLVAGRGRRAGRAQAGARLRARRPPIPRITSPIRRFAAPSPTISSASALCGCRRELKELAALCSFP